MERKWTSILTCIALVALAVAPVVADHHEEAGTIARVTFWEVDSGSIDELEAGLKAHNELHAEQGDPVPILTWMVTSGPNGGKYGRGSFGHHWSDFDDDTNAEADVADMAANVDPYVVGAETGYWQALPDISISAGGPGAVTNVVEFRLKPFQEQAFKAAVKKIHEALVEADWEPYEWYELEQGGHLPTFVVAVPRDGFAGFEEPETSMGDVVRAKYGDETAEIFAALAEATKSMSSYTAIYRPDLSYLPEGARAEMEEGEEEMAEGE